MAPTFCYCVPEGMHARLKNNVFKCKFILVKYKFKNLSLIWNIIKINTLLFKSQYVCVEHNISFSECNSDTTQKCPFWVNITMMSTIKTTKNQQNTIKAGTIKAIPKYYNGVSRRHILFCSFLKHIICYLCHYCSQWAIYLLQTTNSYMFRLLTKASSRCQRFKEDA